MATQLKFMTTTIFTLLFFLMLCGFTYGRFYDSSLISDGVEAHNFPPLIRLRAGAEEACDPSYGFLPCTTTALGNTFLILAYGYLMYIAATCLSNGSELLLQILGPGIVGGLFLPVLGALPDAMLILVSGLSGSTETAQSQVSVGMGLLAGSTIMLITVIWGTCIVIGKCDIENSVAVDSKDTKRFSLTGSGVTTDIWTSYAGIIMAISVVPFLIVQLPQILHSNSGRHTAVLIALIVSVSSLVSYCLYQVFQPWIQRRRLAYVKHKHIIAGVLKHFKDKHSFGNFCTEDGKPNAKVLEEIFTTIDVDKDEYLSYSELQALIVGMHFGKITMDKNDAVDKLMKDFDTSHDSKIDMSEFISGVERWLEVAKGNNTNSHSGSVNYIDDYHMEAEREHESMGEQSDESVEENENPRWNSIKAALLLLLGTVIAAVFADPLVDAVDNFSSATSIPTFFISFIALPLATNSSEAVSAIIFASRKNLRSASLTFSELYGSVTMNNALCLSVFLALVYTRGLDWDFSSEVLVILFVCIVVGVFASTRTTFPLWTALVAFLLYPFSLAIVYVLDYIFGWS